MSCILAIAKPPSKKHGVLSFLLTFSKKKKNANKQLTINKYMYKQKLTKVNI